MKKILFPFDNQPKQFSFKFSDPIRFPFYINDLVYYWEITPEGAILYLNNHKISDSIPIIKDVIIDDSGIIINLINEETLASKHIMVEFAKISKGVHTLGLLDPFTLDIIDPLTLGDISECYANWLNMEYSEPVTSGDKAIYGNDDNSPSMFLEHNDTLTYNKDVYIEDIYGSICMTGLRDQGFLTIGELDSHTLNHIDAMFTTFRKFSNIAASLIKEIRIVHRNLIVNNIAVPQFNVSVDATNITSQIIPNVVIWNRMFYVSNITPFEWRLQSNSVVNCLSDLYLLPQTNSSGLFNGRVSISLDIT